MVRLLSLLLLCATVASAVRVPDWLDTSSVLFGQGSLKVATEGFARRHKGDEAVRVPAYVAIRFVVPPSVAEKFEDAWLKLEKDVMRDEKRVAFFDLKRHQLNNLMYWSYGEWERMGDFHDHLTSDHFQDFADFVDDQGITWEVKLLTNLSEDIEEEQQGEQEEQDEQDEQGLHLERRRSSRSRRRGGSGEQGDQGEGQGGDWDENIPEEYRHYIPKQYRPKHKKGHSHKKELSAAALASLGADADDEAKASELYRALFRHRHMYHVATLFMVPPGKGKAFTEAWRDTAKEVIKEKGNRIYNLRKVASDNTLFVSYGTWDRLTDFMDHATSKHVAKLGEHVTKENIPYFIIPLDKIGREPESS